MSVLFCDSNCELWYDVLKSNGVKLIKMPYYIDGNEHFYDCGEATNFNQFYRRLREKSKLSTAALTTKAYFDIFEPYFKTGEDILYISFSSKMSATFEFLDDAIKKLQAKYPSAYLEQFDTLNISLGAGILVYYAIKLKEQGLTNTRIIEKLTFLREKVGVYFVVDDLNHLKRNKRLSGGAAFMGTLLQTKPILSVENGILKSTDKVSGRKSALQELLRKFNVLCDKNYREVWIVGADCEDDVDFLKNQIKKKYGDMFDVKKQPIGPVVSTHCGPGALGIIFIKK